MPPHAAVHTHAFDKARSGQQQAARRREASGPARLLPPAPEATGDMHAAQRRPGRGEQASPSAGAPAARGPPTAARGPPTATFRLPTCQSQPA